MEQVQHWAAVICLTVLAAALLQYLCPEGAFSKLLKIVLGAFVMCCILQPLSQIPTIHAQQAMAISTNAPKKLSQTVSDQIEKQVKQNLFSSIQAQLSAIGINCKKVDVFMDTDEHGRIVLKRVAVTVEYSKNCERAAALLTRTLGLETEVTADGD